MNTQIKKRWLHWLAYILLFIIVMQAANWWKTRDAVTGNLSNSTAVLMDGSSVTLSDLSGKPILFHFWATWCPICELQNDTIQSISESHQVISIASWSGGETEVINYMRDKQLSYPVILDSSGELAQSFGLRGVPASFILDPIGEIAFVETGYSTELGLRLRLWLSTL